MSNYETECFYLLDKHSKKKKHLRLATFYVSKLLNTILNKNVELFFLLYKKQRFLEDISLQRRMLSGPLATLEHSWGDQMQHCLNKLRVFTNIVNNYEYHIQPFQKRSIKNNIIGLLRQMKMNNHINQRKMLKNPFALKQNLFLLISANLIKGKNEELMEEFFRTLKGNTRKLTEEEKKFKRFEFMMRALLRNRYAVFFREFLLQDRFGGNHPDNKSQFSDISKFTNNRGQHNRYRQSYNPQYEIPADNFRQLKGAMSFENKEGNRSSRQEFGFMHSEVVGQNNQSPFEGMPFSRISKSQWRQHPKLFLPSLLKHIFEKRQKPIFEYMKIMLMLEALDNKKKGNNALLLNSLKGKFGNDKGVSMKLVAILLNKLLQFKVLNIKLAVMRQLKNKETRIHKVLFGKVKPVKLQTHSILPGLNQQSMARMTSGNYNTMNHNSYLNIPYNIQPDQLSMCKQTHIANNLQSTPNQT
jgi:hypothetical protein